MRWLLAALLAGPTILTGPTNVEASDWPQFRGPASNGTAAGDAVAPRHWSPEQNVAWIAELPGEGYSQPVVANGRVFVTSSSGHEDDRLHITCFDSVDGRRLWDRQFWATGRTNVFEPEMRVATPTPLVTQDRVFATFSSNDVICLDYDGRLQWLRGLTYDYPNATSSIGMASSPALAGDTLVCQLETDDASFAIGLDVATGDNRWKFDRLAKANWTSPVAVMQKSRAIVLLEGADGVQAVEPKTGQTLWTFEAGGSTVSSLSAADDVAYVPADGLTAVRMPADGSHVETLWNNRKLSCSFVSPVLYRDRVYTINSAGVLNCGDIKTGELVWQLRLRGDYWATPSATGGHLYCPSKDGQMKVVDVTGEKGRIVAENDFQEPLLSPAAIVDAALYVRTDTKLWKIAAEKAE